MTIGSEIFVGADDDVTASQPTEEVMETSENSARSEIVGELQSSWEHSREPRESKGNIRL